MLGNYAPPFLPLCNTSYATLRVTLLVTSRKHELQHSKDVISDVDIFTSGSALIRVDCLTIIIK